MHKNDNGYEFGLRVFIRYADTQTHTNTAAEEGDGLRKLNGKTGSAHSWTGVSFHSCANRWNFWEWDIRNLFF